MKAKLVVDFNIEGYVPEIEDILKSIETMISTGNATFFNKFYKIKIFGVSAEAVLTDEEYAEQILKEK